MEMRFSDRKATAFIFAALIIISPAAFFNFSSGTVHSPVESTIASYPINLNIIFNDHQPLYKIVGSSFYQLPWTEAHATAEYIEQPLIAGMYPNINVTYELSGSLLYQLVNISNDPHYNNTYIADSFIPYTDLNTSENVSLLSNITYYYFSTPGYVYDLGEPASNLYSSLHNLWQSETKLNATQFEDAKVLWFLYDISTPLVEGELGSKWVNGTIWNLHNQTNFNQGDLTEILQYSKWLTGQVINTFRGVEMTPSGGNVELETSPFYHPLVPLMLSDSFNGPSGTISKSSFVNDTRVQFLYGMGQFENLFGTKPSGVWMPESAVSNQTVGVLNQSGYQWSQSSEFTLQQSGISALAYGNTGANATTMENLYTPYSVSGANGSSTVMFFRDDVLSNDWAFNYGSLSTPTAVSDFINYLKGVYNTIPMDHHNDTLVTVALDGENWMFMSPFALDGVQFLERLYAALKDNSTYIRTVTPTQYLDTHRNLPTLKNLADGSWNQGNEVSAPFQSITSFTQWSGYPVQDFYWISLNDVRNRVIDYQAANNLVQLTNYSQIVQNLSADTNEGNLTRAWNALYAAEGSDWFFAAAPWDISGSNTVPFDLIFKGDLVYALDQIGSTVPSYLSVHPVAPITPSSVGEPNLALTPTINGYQYTSETIIDGTAFSVSQNNGWKGSTVYENNSSDTGTLNISQVEVAYNPTDLFVQVVVNGNASSYINSNDQRLALYLSGPGLDFSQGNVLEDVPFTNFGTMFGNTLLGFPISTMLELSPYNFRSDGSGQFAVYKAGGFGVWNYQLQDVNTLTYLAQSIQFAIPLSYLGIVPGETFYLGVVASTLRTTVSEINPILVSIPASLATFAPISAIRNPVPDNGPGNYTYPDKSTQIPNGALDMQWVNVSLNDYDVQWNFTFGQMWNVWNGPNGFSNQIIAVYIIESNGTGTTSLGIGPNANSSEPWQYMIYISGWATYVSSFMGEQFTNGMTSMANLSSRTISVVVPLSVIGSSVENYRYVIVAGSYDGYGVQGWRIVDPLNTSNSGWQGGGGSPPWSSNIYDYIAPSTVGEGSLTQQEALSYHNGSVPVLSPITLPLLENAASAVEFNSTEYSSPSIVRQNSAYFMDFISNISGEGMVYLYESSDLKEWNLEGPLRVSAGANSVSISILYTMLITAYSEGKSVRIIGSNLTYPWALGSPPVQNLFTITYTSNVSDVAIARVNQSELAILANIASGSIDKYNLTLVSYLQGKMSVIRSSTIASGDSNGTVAAANSTIFLAFYNTTQNQTIHLYAYSTELSRLGSFALENVTGITSNLAITAISGQDVSIAYSQNESDRWTLSVVNHSGYSSNFGAVEKIVSSSGKVLDPTITTFNNDSKFTIVAAWEQESSTGYGIWASNTSITISASTSHNSKHPSSLDYGTYIAIIVLAGAVLAAMLFLSQRRKR